MAGYIGTQAVSVNTTSATITGDASIGGDLSLGDSDKAIFGAGSDLQIYHDGSNSYVQDSGTGDLIIRGSNNIRLQSNSGETYVIGELNGPVYLRHNDVNKLATKATGVTVTGEMAATTMDLSSNAVIDGTLGVAGVVTANAGVVVDNITIDGQEIDVSSGDLTLDVAGDIYLNADGGQVYIKDGSTNIATFENSANALTLTDGNLIVVAGHGVVFGADGTGAGADASEILDDYEEGSWTPTSAGAGAVDDPGTVRGNVYTKIGNQVTIQVEFVVPSNSQATQAFFAGLPYPTRNDTTYRIVGSAGTSASHAIQVYLLNNQSSFGVYKANAFGALTYADLSGANLTINFQYSTA